MGHRESDDLFSVLARGDWSTLTFIEKKKTKKQVRYHIYLLFLQTKTQFDKHK